jgi:MFS family permease
MGALLEVAPPRLREPERYLALTAAFGSFLTSFDASAVNAALPFVSEGFRTTRPIVQWVLLAELLVTSRLLLLFGRLGDQFGPKRICLAGFKVFVAGAISKAL